MKTKPPSTPDDPEQAKRFIDMAREVQADETEEGADRVFKKVALPKTPSSPNQNRSRRTDRP